jgi:hypothetical protein
MLFKTGAAAFNFRSRKMSVHMCMDKSSLARQPRVGPGLPQKLLPAKDLAIASLYFVMSIFQGGVFSPTPNPWLTWMYTQQYFSGLMRCKYWMEI